MFAQIIKSLAAAAIICAAAVPARAAQPIYVNVNLFSSPVGWSANGDHADLVLSYSANAKVPLLIYGIETDDISGAAVSSTLSACGQLLFGGPDGSREIQPGDHCLLRIYRSPAEIASRLILWDGSGTPANINTNVRASLEIRDGSDNVQTHVDLR